MENLVLSTTELLLLSTIATFTIIQLIYYLGLYNRILRNNKAIRKERIQLSTELPPVSIVMYARNEAENLRQFLPAILEQDYPEFEVIVINDASTDDTDTVLELLERKYKNLYRSFTPESARYISHKKLALTLGVKASKYDWLVFTETNCEPASNQWLRLMARHFTPQTDIVLGVSNYKRAKGWFYKCITFDHLFGLMRHLGYAIAGYPYMGSGRNLAYRKSKFYEQKGYSSHLNLQRGEDDIFINRIAKGHNTRVETSKDAIMYIKAAENRREWKDEKINYKVTSRYYKGSQPYFLGFETITRLLFHISFILITVWSILQSAWLALAITGALWIVRYMAQAIIFNRTAKVLNERRRFFFSLPFFDILLPIESLKYELYRKIHRKSDFLRK